MTAKSFPHPWMYRVFELLGGMGNSPIERLESQLRLVTFVAAMRVTMLVGWFGDSPSVARGFRALCVLVSVAFAFAVWKIADRLRERAEKVGPFGRDLELVGSHLPDIAVRSQFASLEVGFPAARFLVFLHVLNVPHQDPSMDIMGIVCWAIAWIYVIVSIARDHRALRAIFNLGPARVRAWRLPTPSTGRYDGASVISVEVHCLDGVCVESAKLVCLARDREGRFDARSRRWTEVITNFTSQNFDASAPIGGYVTLTHAQVADIALRSSRCYLECVLVERVAIGQPKPIEPLRASYFIPIEW